MEHTGDPWFVALVIVLVLWGILTLYAVRRYLKEWIVLGMAIPPALFRKVFGPPRH